MRDKEKMISGLIYDPADKGLAEMRQAAHILSKKYNVYMKMMMTGTKFLMNLFQTEEQMCIFKDQSSLTMDVLPK